MISLFFLLLGLVLGFLLSRFRRRQPPPRAFMRDPEYEEAVRREAEYFEMYPERWER